VQEYQEILPQTEPSIGPPPVAHGLVQFSTLSSQPSSTGQQQSPKGNMEAPTEMCCIKLENDLVPQMVNGTYLEQFVICRLPADRSQSPSATEVVLLATTG
jgi:hypothetical protein